MFVPEVDVGIAMGTDLAIESCTKREFSSMKLECLIDALSNSAGYPFPVTDVDVLQTHISVVFLAGSYVYKLKKPVNLGFLDFSTLEKRRHFCEEEVRLNRRLAPTVYLGVVPVTQTETVAKFEGDGEPVEWAVKMHRLPEQATLLAKLLSGGIEAEPMRALAQRIASFHAQAERSATIAAFGNFDVVSRNARENFEQSTQHVGITLSANVFDRLKVLTDEALVDHRTLIEQRASRGVPCDTHGDLHLDHVYLFPDNPSPGDLVIIDCIEFSERFRFADPVSDMAFLVMDLLFHGRSDLAHTFANAYFQESRDDEARPLLPFYIAYRAAVRGKVEGIKSVEKEVPDAERSRALASARAHWLLALGQLETPARTPCIVLIGGLPGTGKSTLARGLAEAAGFRVIRSDIVRKELAGLEGGDAAPAAFGDGIYTPEWSERTYAECRRRAGDLLFEGYRVIVDASFPKDETRQDFLELANRLGVPSVFLECQAGADTVRTRLDNRRGDVSDADWSIYSKAQAQWEEPGLATRQVLRKVPTGPSQEVALTETLEWLRELKLDSSVVPSSSPDKRA